MALIVLAIATGFIDAIPVEATIVLCALGVAAGLVGVPLYIAHLLAGWRSPGPSKAATSATTEGEGAGGAERVGEGERGGGGDGADAAVARVDAAKPEPLVEPEVGPDSVTGGEGEPDLRSGQGGADGEVPAEPESPAVDSPQRSAPAQPRCSCHGLPVAADVEGV
ncbi:MULTISPECIES: hypothetical protein [Tsukamurella]|uniref:Uncharacterized protein n=2 Tax=Tsukamurella TaxID=2060 RepID=A0A5C5S0A4_9ACTN|nr:MULTISPECIES: hypothetical protein [Tsukamurella]NMD56042.1 hypothetical protein [Tsukamurella columbiensis]TWS28847.1 hypothetical protein FK530_11700 [Tsukamurella conjunctivitidis]